MDKGPLDWHKINNFEMELRLDLGGIGVGVIF